jgi:hypothetical protein
MITHIEGAIDDDIQDSNLCRVIQFMASRGLAEDAAKVYMTNRLYNR